MQIEYRIRSPRFEFLLFAAVHLGLAAFGVSWVRFSSGGLHLGGVLSLLLMGLAPAWFLWLAVSPIGDRILIEVAEDKIRISKNDVEIFSGGRLSPSEFVEDGVAFHFCLPSARCAFTLPKKRLSEAAIKALQGA